MATSMVAVQTDTAEATPIVVPTTILENMTFSGTIEAYKDTCAAFMRALCNDKDMKLVRPFLAEGCTLVHDDMPPAQGVDDFIERWSKELEKMPDYHIKIIDIICEPAEEKERGAVLWVYSRITGIPEAKGRQVDCVDMMKFDADGKFFYTKDVQRTVADTTAILEMKTAWGNGYVSRCRGLKQSAC